MVMEKDKKQEDFVFDIDDTIDNLFQPTRKIEIDPLTQEIKTISEDPDDVSTSPDLVQDKGLDDKKPDEIEMFSEDSEALAVEEAESKTTEFKLPEYLEQIAQQFLTIEWEVNESEINKALALMKGLHAYEEIKNNESASELTNVMQELLQVMGESPETASTRAPATLNTGVGLLQALFDPSNSSAEEEFNARYPEFTEELMVVLNECSEQEMGVGYDDVSEQVLELELEPSESEEVVLEPEEVEEVQEVGVNMELVAEDESEEAKHEDISAEEKEKTKALMEDVAEPVIEEADESVVIESSQEDRDRLASEVSDFVSDDEIERVESEKKSGEVIETRSLYEELNLHLNELGRCITKIKALEDLLEKAESMEKLYQFQKSIRLILERQKSTLDLCLGQNFTEQELAAVSESAPSQASPWDSLLKVHWGEKVVLVLEDEVACARKLSVFKQGKLSSINEFPLSLYKSMPWSKLKSCVKGCLKDVDEKALKEISVPFIRSAEDTGTLKKSMVLLLHDGSQGVALPILREPEIVNLDDLFYNPVAGADSAGFEQGFMRDGEGNLFPVITVKSLLTFYA